MTRKQELPKVGNKYKAITGDFTINIGEEMEVYEIAFGIYAYYKLDDVCYKCKLTKFWERFEELPDQEPVEKDPIKELKIEFKSKPNCKKHKKRLVNDAVGCEDCIDAKLPRIGKLYKHCGSLKEYNELKGFLVEVTGVTKNSVSIKDPTEADYFFFTKTLKHFWEHFEELPDQEPATEEPESFQDFHDKCFKAKYGYSPNLYTVDKEPTDKVQEALEKANLVLKDKEDKKDSEEYCWEGALWRSLNDLVNAIEQKENNDK